LPFSSFCLLKHFADADHSLSDFSIYRAGLQSDLQQKSSHDLGKLFIRIVGIKELRGLQARGEARTLRVIGDTSMRLATK
jgi:hypothetical protein